jgi:hypothetical protein
MMQLVQVSLCSLTMLLAGCASHAQVERQRQPVVGMEVAWDAELVEARASQPVIDRYLTAVEQSWRKALGATGLAAPGTRVVLRAAINEFGEVGNARMVQSSARPDVDESILRAMAMVAGRRPQVGGPSCGTCRWEALVTVWSGKP